MGKQRVYTKELLERAVEKSKSYAETCRNLGISDKGGNIRTIKNKISSFNIDISHFTGQLWSKGLTSGQHPSIKKKDLKDIFIENSGWGSDNLKKRLFREGVKECKCEICGISEWLGKPITLQLHHLNGNHRDNRLENLQILCPNCHSQTDNYARKNNSLKGGMSTLGESSNSKNGLNGEGDPPETNDQ